LWLRDWRLAIPQSLGIWEDCNGQMDARGPAVASASKLKHTSTYVSKHNLNRW
jgi:hypothetical protein